MTSQQYQGMTTPGLHGRELKAVIFDVDGTLYRQTPIRRTMLRRLFGLVVASPRHGAQTLRVLRAYRQAQEALRAGVVAGGIADAQIRLASERTNVDVDAVVQCVTKWMEEEPLASLQSCVQPGALEFLRRCRVKGLQLAALSDYPAEAKLRALGMTELFAVVRCAQSPDVNVFKPNPRGLHVILERLGLLAAECLYVGDRADVDAATAESAGMRCAILTGRSKPPARSTYTQVASFSQLHDLLWPGEAHASVR
jgi:phosphoglycolate phosphatase/putative hydrolase of the HAD superfamily